MNDNAKKWVAALRSGEFEQGSGYLCLNNQYCCLGVACVVAERNGVSLKRGTRYDRVTFDGEINTLPTSVQDWLGISSIGGEYRDGALWVDNDTNHLTFSQIADIIESEPEGLFVKEAV